MPAQRVDKLQGIYFAYTRPDLWQYKKVWWGIKAEFGGKTPPLASMNALTRTQLWFAPLKEPK